MRKNLLFLLFCFLFSISAFSTHIVGGALTYEHLGGSTYRVILKLYCAPGNAGFPNTANILVRQPNGTAYSTISIPFPGATAVPQNIDTCVTNPGICLQEAIYSAVVNNLPPNNGGYHMYYQLCCRNASLANITNPLSTGASWYTFIPDNNIWLSNSSPQWAQRPPVFVCQNQPLNFDHKATDADGDSLSYSLYTPYNNTAPTFPGNVATFTPVNWSNTNTLNPPTNMYGATMALGGPPGSLTINPVTGLLNGSPPFVGQFVVGVRCTEWRNGVRIGEILRDFQFNVVYCPPVSVAAFTTQGNCTGSTVCFTNQTSPPSNTYFWDFGNPLSTTDTSYAANPPCYTYPGNGPYTVTLISNYGTACADTATQTIYIAYANAAFTSTSPVCAGSPIQFTDGSTASPGNNINSWSWNFGDGSPVSNQQNPVHVYANGGTYTVTLTVNSTLGCSSTTTMTVTIQSKPIANAGVDTTACTNNPIVNLGGTVLNASGGQWVGAGTFSPSNTSLNATYTPTAGEIGAGSATLLLITTGNGVCVADTDTIVITFTPGPTVTAGPDLFVCKDTAFFTLNGSVTLATGGTWSTTNGTGTFNPGPNQLNTNYFPSPGDTALGSVTFVLQTTGNGNCNPSYDTVVVFFTNPPTVAITAPDSACAGSYISLSGSSTTGSGYWTTMGSGSFLPSDSILNPSYLPSAADDAAGFVLVIFNSSNNGGCRVQRDTVRITLIPSPVAAFTNTTVCPYATTSFTDGSTTSVGSITSWNWNFGDATPNGTQQNPSHVYINPGSYQVTLVVTSSNGCVDTLVQTVNVHFPPVANFGNLTACQNDGVQFLDSSTTQSGTISGWLWNFGDNGTGNIQNPNHVYANAGSYNVTLIVTNSVGCSDTITRPVVVNPQPNAAFIADDYTAVIGQTINFTDQSQTNIVSWNWNFGDGSPNSNQQNPSHTYNQGGIYTVTLIVIDANGCSDTITDQIIISLPPLLPSGFSPNGDGSNDILFVKGGPFKDLDFRVYNNWGELLFISTSQSVGWDGRRNGIEQPMGVYIYTVRGTTEDNVKHELKGDVTLVR
jgi:gliding motility-associated-like protein